MIRKFLLATLPALILSAGNIREEILVVVNDHIITRRIYQQAVEQESAALYRQYTGAELDERLQDTRDQTLQGLIDSFVLEDKARDLGVQVTDEQLRAIVEDVKRNNKFTSDADFDQALRSNLGIGLNDYIKDTRRKVVQQEVLRREIYSKVAVDEQELRAYYEQHRDEYRAPSRFRIRELVLPKGVTSEEQKATQEKLQTILSSLKSGKIFEALVKEYSMSPTQSTGGDLGWLSTGILRPSIEEAALALKANQVSEPIESDKDFTLVQLLEADLDAVKPFNDVKTSIMEKLQEPKATSAIQNYLSQLRARANIRYMVPRDLILKG